VPFDERPALVRTRDGMTRFVAVEGGPIDEPVASTSAVTLDMPLPVPTGGSTTNSPSPASKPLPLPLQQLLPNGRASRPPAPKSEPMAPSLSVDTEKDAVQTWWEAAGSADLLRNGLPRCRFVDAPPETLLEPLFDDESGNAIALRMAGNLAILRQIRRRRQELLRGSESVRVRASIYRTSAKPGAGHHGRRRVRAAAGPGALAAFYAASAVSIDRWRCVGSRRPTLRPGRLARPRRL
jgi:hypothetical protein